MATIYGTNTYSCQLGSILIDMGHIPEAEAPIQKASKLLNPGNISLQVDILVTKITAAQNVVALSYLRMRITQAIFLLFMSQWSLIYDCSVTPHKILTFTGYCIEKAKFL